MTTKNKAYTGQIMSLLTILQKGDSFHTELKPSIVTSYAKAHKRVVKTEQCILTENYTKSNPVCKKLTKVTIL
jgi:hypothetical protein